MGLELNRFNAVEITCLKITPLADGTNTYEIVSELEEPNLYSVYLRYNPDLPENEDFGGVECVADFTDMEDATILADALEILIG